jgi:tRNA (guanosine-2'-O-)-methyltransferase
MFFIIFYLILKLVFFLIFAKINLSNMIDLKYLSFLENMLTENRKERFLEILQNRTNHFTVAIEDVFQLHNTSAVMRSCEVFGIQELHVVEEKFGKRIDAEIAMGAQKWVDVNRYDTIDDCIENLKNKGYQIIATTPHENDCLLEDFDITKKSALFFGTEKAGLSESVLKQADGFLKIPMVGFTESLNISVSAAIILQNISTRLRKSHINWQLSDEELLEKRLSWTRNSIKDIKRIEARYFETNS